MKRELLPLGLAVVALLVGLAALALGLTLAGADAARALGALASGALGSWDAVLSAWLPRATPLIVIGLGLAIAFRGGALNIGAEGQFYAGAIAATALGIAVGAWHSLVALPTVLLAAMAGGIAWVLVPVLLRVRFGVLEVISTLLLNFVAEALVSFMVLGPLQEARRTYPQSDLIAESARLPRLPGTRLHLGLLLALGLALLTHVILRRSWWGFALRAVGHGPRAARVAGGLEEHAVTAAALVCSGALAGLAGGMEVAGISYALFQNLSPGYGFSAIAVALLARLHPLGVVATGLLFGALEAGASAMQREAQVPAVAVYLVEAGVIITVLLSDAVSRRRAGLPRPATPPGSGAVA